MSAGAQLRPVFDGLNACAATGWRVNGRVLALVESVLARHPCGLGLVPRQLPRPPPQPPPVRAGGDEEGGDGSAAGGGVAGAVRASVREWRRQSRLVDKLNAEDHSLRCALQLKLGVARQLAGETFYFAYNLDFRGRAYPCSPHLSVVGDDLARGLLQYAEPRPVGEAGLRWLKDSPSRRGRRRLRAAPLHGVCWEQVHAASLYGHDKLPLHERAEWVDAQLASGRIAAVASAPLDEENRAWLLGAENPFQLYAVGHAPRRKACAGPPPPHAWRAVP